MRQLSVIIPALNEADNIRFLLDQLAAQEDIQLETIVVDGGSVDDTCGVASASQATLIETSAGRGLQMNAGAHAASNEWLLFLHADSELTDRRQLAVSLDQMRDLGESFAGHFPLSFSTTDPGIKRSLQFFEAKTQLNRPGTFNGDQGLLINAARFRLLGGFQTRYRFLEDQEFGERFRDSGTFVTLPFTLRTSARRFEDEGVSERIMLNAIIMGMFTLGHDNFFRSAPSIYRTAGEGDQLNLLPFFTLARRSVFDAGWIRGIVRCFSIGRYVSSNIWQLFLLRGLKIGDVEKSLQEHDRYFRFITGSFLGTLLATPLLVGWFLVTELRLRYRYE